MYRVNPCHAELGLGNINRMYLYFLNISAFPIISWHWEYIAGSWHLTMWMTSTFLSVTWWHKEPGHQQPRFEHQKLWSLKCKTMLWDLFSPGVWLRSFLTLKWRGNFFFKMWFHFLMLFTLCAIVLYETGPIQWMFSQHCGYWWPGALAPGQQYSHSADYAPMRFPVFKG